MTCFDRIARHFRIGNKDGAERWFRWWRQFIHRRVTTPSLTSSSRSERRSSVNFMHRWVDSLVSRERNAFQSIAESSDGSCLRQSREMAEGHERKGHPRDPGSTSSSRFTSASWNPQITLAAFQEPWRRPAYWLAECRYPSQSGDKFGPDISTHCASTCRYK